MAIAMAPTMPPIRVGCAVKYLPINMERITKMMIMMYSKFGFIKFSP
ncbi:MAG: hypothetical protein LHV68_03640 [Elusimicrobia bacterium]|nr:hypothetical protein [Candidatus Liberimonas magnetica]